MDDRNQRSRRQARQSAPSAATGSNLGDAQAGAGASSSASSSVKKSPFYVSTAMTLAASQNLPAVLNDPNKGRIECVMYFCMCVWNSGYNFSNFFSLGKQRDFFTRSWGDTFTETRPVPPSAAVCDLPPNSFERYLKKVRKHRRLHSQISRIVEEPSPSKVDANSNKAS